MIRQPSLKTNALPWNSKKWKQQKAVVEALNTLDLWYRIETKSIEKAIPTTIPLYRPRPLSTHPRQTHTWHWPYLKKQSKRVSWTRFLNVRCRCTMPCYYCFVEKCGLISVVSWIWQRRWRSMASSLIIRQQELFVLPCIKSNLKTAGIQIFKKMRIKNNAAICWKNWLENGWFQSRIANNAYRLCKIRKYHVQKENFCHINFQCVCECSLEMTCVWRLIDPSAWFASSVLVNYCPICLTTNIWYK